MLRLLAEQVHPYHVLTAGVQSLLVAGEQGFPPDFDVNFLIVGNICPVPGANGGVHANAANHHVNPLPGQHVRHPEGPLCAFEPAGVRVADVFVVHWADLVAVQQDHIAALRFPPPVEQSAQRRFPRPGQAGEEIYRSLFHANLL